MSQEFPSYACGLRNKFPVDGDARRSQDGLGDLETEQQREYHTMCKRVSICQAG